jgi:site-specific recombinase XerD
MDAINACLLAQWFITQIRSHVPNTVNARLADIMLVMRHHPAHMLVHLEEKDIIDSIDESMVASSRRARVGDSLKQFYRYIQATLGIRVPEIAWWKLRDQPVIREYRLLTQPKFARLLAHSYPLKKIGHIAVAALLIGYYFGLRVSEISRLRIGELWISGTPTVIVHPSKRGYSRFVEGIQIPPSVIQFLQGVRTARLQKEGGEYSAFLLVDDQNKQLTTHRLIRLMSDGLVAAGIKDSAVSLYSAVHLLRHACANRWWALGVPLIDIAHKLGHRSPDTTIRTYLHIAPFLQYEECSRIRELEIGFSKKGLAYLLGITVARLNQLECMMFSPLGKGQDEKREEYTLSYTIGALEHLLALSKDHITTAI